MKSAETTIVDDNSKVVHEHEVVIENQNGDKVITSEDHDNLDVNNYHSAEDVLRRRM